MVAVGRTSSEKRVEQRSANFVYTGPESGYFRLQVLFCNYSTLSWTNIETKGVALLQSNVTYKNRPWAGFGLLAVVCQPLD